MIDHVAEESAGTEVGNTIHRISPTLTKTILEEAGFVFEAENNTLINFTDDITRNVFARDLRGNTSRFIHRYSNP